MKRRRFLQALALAPLAPKLAAVEAAPVRALPPRRTNFASLSREQVKVWSRETMLAYRRSR